MSSSNPSPDSRVRELGDLPSPPGWPLLGNALQLDPKRLHLVLEDWSRRFGSAYTIGLGPRRVLIVSDVEWLQTALRDRPQRWRRYSPIESVIEEMGWNGLFSVEGEAWAPQRRLVMQALAATHFRAFFPALRAITERLMRRWRLAADTAGIVEMTDDLVRYTVDVTTALAFGEDPNTLEQPGDVIQDHLARVFPMVNARINAPIPLWRLLKMPKDRQLERSLIAIDTHIHGLIDRTRARRHHAEHGAPPANLLEAMLAAAAEPDSGIDDAAIAANVKTLLLAGEDTTAQTLAWTMPFLCADPALQQRLQAVAAGAMGHARVCAGFDNLRNLDLFEALAHEATRLKPIIPIIFLETLTEVVLGDLALPAGTPVFFLLRPAMLDEQHFGEAARFLPDRWLPGRSMVEPHDPRAYVQFGAGPRVCPGRHLAGVELRLVLSMLMRNFSVDFAGDPEAIDEVMSFTMMPSEMPVRLRRLRR